MPGKSEKAPVSSSSQKSVKTLKTSHGKQIKHTKEKTRSEYDDDLDLRKPLHPLSHYVKNRSELLDQLFRCFSKDNSLQEMLPDILKNASTSEIKKFSLQQLEVMSKKRICRILTGEEMSSSSGTDDSDDNDVDVGFKENVIKKIETNESLMQPADSTSHDISIPAKPPNESKLSSSSSSSSADMAVNDCGKTPSSPNNNSDMLELHPDSADDMLLNDGSSTQVTKQTQADQQSTPETKITTQTEVPHSEPMMDPSLSIAKTCMEILELELRARAIKSLLKTQSVDMDTTE